MLSCREVSGMVASGSVETAGRWLRLRVRLHLLWCRLCRRYVRELRAIAALAREMAGSGEEATWVRAAEDRLSSGFRRSEPGGPA